MENEVLEINKMFILILREFKKGCINSRFYMNDHVHQLINDNIDYMVHLEEQCKDSLKEFMRYLNELDKARRYHEELKKEALLEVS